MIPCIFIFCGAAAYGKSALADSEVRPLYEAIAKEKDMPIFAVMIADFFNAPTIHNVDLSAYNGQTGNAISILATDDFRVESVHVSITNDQGNVLESGNAIPVTDGRWNYQATATITTPVTIEVVARDYPGGVTVEQFPFTKSN